MRALRACLLVLVGAFVVAGCSGSGSPGPAGGGGGGGGGGALPPVGVVWFGSAFDPATLAVTGQSASIKAGSPIVAVGNFLQPKPPEDMTVVIQKLGTTVARLPLPAGQPSKTFGIDLTPQKLGAGNYLVNFVDKNRRTLAAGNLVVTP
jgi:hypothetical protein